MDWSYSYTERAYKKLEHLCVTRYYDKYPRGFDKTGILKISPKTIDVSPNTYYNLGENRKAWDKGDKGSNERI